MAPTRFTQTDGHFSTEEEAVAEIEARGWTAMTLDVVGAVEDFHWHEFDTLAFVLDGTAAAEYEDGTVEEVDAGSRVEAHAGVVHRDVAGTSYRAVFGYSVHPDDMTLPVNKPLPVTI